MEDNEDARRGLEALLRADGYEVTSAENGAAALAATHQRIPDLVLTDLVMPNMHGLALLRRLHERDRALPVIVMTGHTDVQMAIESLRAGADDYLVKPLQYEAVLWHVRRTLARRAANLKLEALQAAQNDRLVANSLRDREHAQLEARHRAELSALLGNLQEGVVIAHRSERIVMVNAAALQLLGMGRDEPRTIAHLDTLVAARTDGPSPGAGEPLLRRALRGESFVDCEVSTTRADGERRLLMATGTSVTNEAHEIVLAVVVFRDVTDAVRLEEQREEYLALISHDLRNPLSNISMCASLLRESAFSRGGAAEVRLAERAEQNVRRMSAMLDELREATTLEGRGVELRTVPCDLHELVRRVVGEMAPADAWRISIEVDAAPSHLVLADIARLERVLMNLLSNALKYSAAEAQVFVHVQRVDGAVRVAIVDHGIGIPPVSIELLFRRYYRASAAKARAGGLGLGLYIARLIVEAHGGRIHVSSAVGVGSTFTVTLPAHDGPG